MEEIHISFAASLFMGISAVFQLLLPVILWIVWRKKTRASWVPLIAGIVGFLFYGTMRGIARTLLLAPMKEDSPWAFYLWQAVFAGVFEEGGKYLVMRFALPNRDHYRDSVSYGIGHSAVEHYAVGGFSTMLYAFLTALFFRTGGMDAFAPGGAGFFLMEGLDEAVTLDIVQTIAERNTVFSCIRGMIESLPVLHICCSVLVFTAVYYDISPKWLFAAIGLHTLVDVIGACYMSGSISHIEANVLELLFNAGLIYLTWRVYAYYGLNQREWGDSV